MLVKTLLQQELLAAKRSLHEYSYSLMVFVLIISLFPMAVGSDVKLLEKVAPGVVWVAVLLSSLLSMDNLFRHDWESGFLDKLLLSPQPLSLIIITKVFAHWVVTGLPLILAAPLLGLFLHLSYQAEWALIISLLLGTPIICLIGAIGAALTLGLRNQSLLLMLLVMPFFIPVLIFGCGAVSAASQQLPVAGQLAFLAGLLCLGLCLAPMTIAGILRVGVAN